MMSPLGPGGGESSRWTGDAVRAHLEVLLNTRQGSYPLRPEYGLPDIPGYYNGDFNANMNELASEIRRVIREFEPRLQNLRVVPEDERDTAQFRVSFLITGEILAGDQPEEVQYKTTIATGQHAEVS